MNKTLLTTSLVLAMAAVPALAQDRTANQNHAQHQRAAQAETNANQTAERPDAWVLTKIKAQYAASSTVGFTDVSVDVTNGAVRLSGSVGSAAEKREAVRLAQTTEGVRTVDASALKLVPEADKAQHDRMKKDRP